MFVREKTMPTILSFRDITYSLSLRKDILHCLQLSLEKHIFSGLSKI